MNEIFKENTANANMLYWAFTAWDDPKITELPDWMTYIVYGKEVCPETMTTHWQGYMELCHKYRASTLKNNFKKYFKVEKIKFLMRYPNSSGHANMLYCKKGAQPKDEWEDMKDAGESYGFNSLIVEFGEYKISQQGKRTDLKEVSELVKKNITVKQAIDEGHITGMPQLKTFQALLPYYEPPRKLAQPPIVHIYWGSTGCGKSHAAREFLGEDHHEHSYNKDWWQGYDGEKKVLFDDFRDDQVPFSKLLKILDKGPIVVECKNGSRQLQANVFVFTCPKHPKDWYMDIKEDINQLMRRITHIEYFNKPFEINNKYFLTEKELDERKEKNRGFNSYDALCVGRK